MLITVKEFATRHKVSPQAIRFNIDSGNLKSEVKFGITLLESKQKYYPVRGRGRKKVKSTKKQRP